jgi:uncharacterized repeat protein (TIGR03803 family)
MAILKRLRKSTLHFRVRAVTGALVLAIMFGLTVVAGQGAEAQTFQVIHTFTGGGDGSTPTAGVTIDGAGNLYGTAFYGGTGYGTVYKLKHLGSGWALNPLYSFTDANDGAYPYARVVFGPSGVLYGTASGGGQYGGGVVFKLGPSPTATACKTALCPWTETVLYAFPGGADGSFPYFGDVIFDQADNMYGTAAGGGRGGVAYELTPPGSWGTESVLHTFTGDPDGLFPDHGVILDTAGNLYGTTYEGGASGAGSVYQLVPAMGGWTENILYSFEDGNDGGYPIANPIFGRSGINLYGTATNAGMGGGGTVYELSPSGSGWTFNPLYSFTGSGGGCSTPGYSGPGPGPWGALAMDEAGSLYGTTCSDGAYGYGNVFELTPSHDGWTYTDLHDFTGGSDGGNPISNVSFDLSGNLYGTASTGGSHGVGVVWEITP